MNFKEKTNPTTTVKVIGARAPRVGITSEALTKMFIYTKECADEIGWLGTVQQISPQHFVIDDVYLFEQRVHGTTTEITPEGLSSFAEELLALPDGMDIWNNIKMWGHSHVNMGLTPSGQDDKQMDEFKSVGHEWFIRLICNKKGEMKLDFFHYQNGVAFLDVPWEELASDEELAIQEKMEALQRELDASRGARETAYNEYIKEEMKTKVTKINSTYKGTNNYANEYGRYVDGVWKSWALLEPTEEEKKTHGKVIPMRYQNGMSLVGTNTSDSSSKKKVDSADEKNENKKEETVDRKGFYLWEDYFDHDEDVIKTFSTEELFELSECKGFNDLEESLETFGWYNVFTDNDLERIYRVAYKIGRAFSK